ncbi:hypothetical protein SAMN07250955_111104 [Arboricoccus pini]|uniref:Uncharacterized protein n=1 Tax=Arboricoccus pini TaxID=1963835 RepID=A0A212RP48_9PROT|nr:hypothetical protein [Arboricoccus pini]SNB74212.1 hypothetical protein SAMN07250955_111104 [Arboricoccus pini]
MGALLAHALSEEEQWTEQDQPLLLSVDDLIVDANGEIVIFSGDGIDAVTLTGATVTHTGRVEFHRTAAGDDVAGFQFLTFDNGMTIFHDPQLRVTVTD